MACALPTRLLAEAGNQSGHSKGNPLAKKIKDHFLLTSQYILAAMGVLLLGYCAIASVRVKAFQRNEVLGFDVRQRGPELLNESRPLLYSRANSTQNPPIEGTALARLTIPDLRLDLMVVEGVSSKDLSMAPGHIPGTSLPGHAGNVGIAGHRDTVFRKLGSVRLNEIITLTTVQGEVRYRVVSLEVVSPSDVRVLYRTSRDTLTLVTCYPFNFVGSAPNRFIVRAERLTTPHSPGERPGIE
jgi:sortase A